MPGINEVVRASGATRRQIDSWARADLLVADLDNGRFDFAESEIDVARALARMSEAGIGVSSKLAGVVCFALRLGNRTKITEAWASIDLKTLANP